MYDDDFGYDEFNDWDATSCANGDYNAWEEEQVFQDREGEEEESTCLVDDILEHLWDRFVMYQEDDRFFFYDSETDQTHGPFDFHEHAKEHRNRLAGVCSCGEGWIHEQYDYYGIYAGRMCDACFRRKYKQGPYNDPGY